MTKARASEPKPPCRHAVIRARIDFASGNVVFDPWAVDDWAGERWVLEARPSRQLRGRAVHWRLEKRGHEIVACTQYRATAAEIVERFGPEAASRFFDPGDQEKEITFEIPVPVGLDFPTEPQPSTQPPRSAAASRRAAAAVTR